MERIVYRKSFTANIVLIRGFSLYAYSAIRNTIDKYNETSGRITFNFDSIIFNKKKIGIVRMSRNKLNVYLPLNPKNVAKKYNVIDSSNLTSYKNYSSRIIVDNKEALNNALSLIEKVIKEKKGTIDASYIPVDYDSLLYERSFSELYDEGHIKRYVINSTSKKDDDFDDYDEELHKVTFTAKLRYCAQYKADELYIVTNYANWDLSKAIKMKKISDNEFVGVDFYPKGTKLEFKICREKNWENVEKGIWKEEIVNHHYLIVDDDLEVEDLIHNFREY